MVRLLDAFPLGVRRVAVCPAGVGKAVASSGVSLIASAVCRSIDIFSVMSVMAEIGGRDVVFGIDDAEHLPDSRRHWTAFLSMIHLSGSSLVVVVPDMGGSRWRSGSLLRSGIVSMPSLPFDASMVALSGGGWERSDAPAVP